MGGHTFALRDLQAMSKERVVSTIECGGNRRDDMNARGGKSVATLGSPWRIGAVSNAEWGGVRLRDLLKSSGMEIRGSKVYFLMFRTYCLFH